MRGFFDAQGRTRILAEAYMGVRRRLKIRGERSASEKELFMNGNYFTCCVDTAPPPQTALA